MERREAERQSRAAARGQWASKTEYILVVAGNVVGLGNVWRFPYLCYRYGGGAFLIPYTLLVVVFGIPLFLLETSLGQFTQEGFITCWRKICPLAQGVGYGYLVLKVYELVYIIIQAWALFYLVFSFRSELPWATCNNSWNTVSGLLRRRMLRMSRGIEEVGSVSWELLLCLLASWVFCYFSIWKGVRSTGKVAYFTATFPYVMLLILLIRGLTLPGAFDGIYFYLYPNLEDLTNLEVWIEAGSQICYSYSLAIGNLIVLGSYNKYNNNCYKDCLWICLLNSCTSFVAGFVVFSVLGFMAQKQGVTIDVVADSGQELSSPLFLVHSCGELHHHGERPVSEAVARPRQTRDLCPGRLFMQLPLSHFVHYRGADRLLDIIGDSIGQRPSVFFKLCWKYVTPALSLISYILYLSDYRDLKINDWYVYPNWAYVLGWMMTFSSAITVPLWVIIHLCSTTGSFREVRVHRNYKSTQGCKCYNHVFLPLWLRW
ncbi:unnamed protein product [Tetraodon nigroviridis]|uniref:Transporter n=1 Tax=Tetraodon nigroviridis TaxID=99883 RepID=Q4SNN5_TETNG|nr:unnamed protein product [Tetraodon nigroviridis]